MTSPPGQPFSVEQVHAALRTVVDPEAGMNIVDLGLVYGVDVDPPAVRVLLTLTSPTCPMGDLILDEARQAITACLPDGWTQDVRLVWEPPWGPQRMSDKARAHFGWKG
ncbi:MAG: metal-sulfur cluster assembly factor [Rhodocyclales bacterium]|nr:metal-sulfur cluster assembly factor [Rhodocyclales bacterium]